MMENIKIINMEEPLKREKGLGKIYMFRFIETNNQPRLADKIFVLREIVFPEYNSYNK